MRETAAQMAQRLAATFLGAGNYMFSNALNKTALAEVLPAAATSGSIDDLIEQSGFSGLSIQSVGYEKGASDPKVHIYVTKGRQTETELGGDSGITVVVNRVGRVVIRPEAASATTHRGKIFERGTRVACGSSCAPSNESYAGTYGALVKKHGSSELYILSNNHVIAAGNHVPVGMPILSPSSIDAGPGVRAPGEIARHAEICELRSGVPSLVSPGREDIAIARVMGPQSVTSWQGDATNGYDTPSSVIAPEAGMAVKKFGRTSGLTKGKVEALINTPFPL
ncbi:MAG: hypothetical protein ABIQ24_03645, partial [Nitrospiraceae bacterium]